MASEVAVPAVGAGPVDTVPTMPIAGQASARPALMALNAAAIVVAALYFGRELLVPLALASLLAFVLAPACYWLQRARLPRVAAVLMTVVLTFGLIGAIGLVVGRQIAAARGQPAYL